MKQINWAWPVTTLAKYDLDALRECVEQHREAFCSHQIIIMGAGIRGTSFSILLGKMGFKDLVFTDNNEEKIGGWINEYPIIPYSEAEKKRGKAVVLVSVENGYSLIRQLEDSGYVYNKDCFFVDSHIYDEYLNKLKDNRPLKTLILGDCGLTDISYEDQNQDALGKMLEDELGAEETKTLAIHAMNMGLFYHVIKTHVIYVSVPEQLVVMTNFETFTGKQHLLPRSQHADLVERLSSEYPQDMELKEYSKTVRNRFENFKLDYFASSQTAMSHMKKEKNDRLVFMMNYMYDLDETIEPIIYLNKIMELGKERNIRIKCFIPPVNYEYAQKLLGERFMSKYSENVSKLEWIIKQGGAELLDLSFVLPSVEFASATTIDETVNYAGRKKILEKLAHYIGDSA